MEEILTDGRLNYNGKIKRFGFSLDSIAWRAYNPALEERHSAFTRMLLGVYSDVG